MEFDERFIGDETIKLIEEKCCKPIEMTEEQKSLFKKFLEKFDGLDSPNKNYEEDLANEKYLAIGDNYIHNFNCLSVELSVAFVHNYDRPTPLGGDCICLLKEEIDKYDTVSYATMMYTYVVINENQICDVGIVPYPYD